MDSYFIQQLILIHSQLFCCFYCLCESSPPCAFYLSSLCLSACSSCLSETDSLVVWPPWETQRPQDSQQSAERQCHVLHLILAAIPVLSTGYTGVDQTCSTLTLLNLLTSPVHKHTDTHSDS